MGTTAKGAARGRAAGAAAEVCLAVSLVSAVLLSTSPARADLPTDGAVAFSYSISPAVKDCSQSTEEELRDLIRGVLHTDPFVPAGEAAPYALKVAITLPRPTLVRARFSLFDGAGVGRGVTVVEDRTCDGAQLKLIASIGLLLQPRKPDPSPVCPACPPPVCDSECQASARKEALKDARREARAAVEAEELPKLREQIRREVLAQLPRRPAVSAVLSAGGIAAFNFAADAAPGFFLAAEARWEHASMMLEARGLFATRGYVAVDGKSTADLASFSAVAAPCLRWRFLSGCALVELGTVVATAGLPASAPLFGLGLRTRIDVPLGAGFEVRVFGDGMGHPLGAKVGGQDATGAGAPRVFELEAPRTFSVFLGAGLGRSFD